MGVGALEALALADGGAANRVLRFAVHVILGLHLLNRSANLRVLRSILPSSLWINLHQSAIVLLVSLSNVTHLFEVKAVIHCFRDDLPDLVRNLLRSTAAPIQK